MILFKNKHCIMTVAAIALFMFFIHTHLQAGRERRGATVVVTMTDGSQVEGELLSVRADALLLYESASGRGWHIYLHQVAQVKVLKRSNFFDGLAIGIGVGFVIGVINLKKIDRESLMPAFEMVGSFLQLPITGLCGGLLGAVFSFPRKFSLAGVSPQSVQQNLERLKRYAREQD
jgi:hypothetical protein